MKIKVAAFFNKSSEILIKSLDFPKVFLPSDKAKDTEIIRKKYRKYFRNC